MHCCCLLVNGCYFHMNKHKFFFNFPQMEIEWASWTDWTQCTRAYGTRFRSRHCPGPGGCFANPTGKTEIEYCFVVRPNDRVKTGEKKANIFNIIKTKE